MPCHHSITQMPSRTLLLHRGLTRGFMTLNHREVLAWAFDFLLSRRFQIPAKISSPEGVSRETAFSAGFPRFLLALPLYCGYSAFGCRANPAESRNQLQLN